MTQITGNNNANRISTTIAVNAGDNFALPVPTNNLQVLALGGADTIDTGAGLVSNSTFQGGSGNDSIAIGLGGAVSSTFFGGEGNDIITVAGGLTSSAIQSLTGDNRVTTAVANLAFIRTDVGSDTINIGQGGTLTQFSTVRAGDGADSININGGVNNSSIYAGNGNDTININGALANAFVQTLTGNNTIGGTALGTLNASSIQTGSGADTIILAGALTNSVVRAGANNDSITLSGVMTNSSIFAGQGNDTISLTTAAVRTGSSFTSITGINRFVFDEAAAAAGNFITNNTFTGAGGTDRLVFTGNAAVDATNLFINNNITAINTAEVALSAGVLTTGAAITARGISNVVITGGNTSGVNAVAALNGLNITGNDNNNVITGGLGADTINSGQGTNEINVGTGLDVVTVNSGSINTVNLLLAGAGNLSTIVVTAGAEAGTTIRTTNTGVLDQRASAAGSSVGVNMTVRAAGDSGFFTGGNGADTLLGNAAVDTLIGGGGADTITGAVGADVLTGGAGADRFVYAVAGQSAASVAADTTRTFDSITDFTGAQGDNFNLDEVGVNFAANATATVVALAVNNVANFAALDAALVAANGTVALGVSTTTSAAVFDITLTGTGLAAAGITRLALVNDGTAALAVTDLMVQMQGGAAALAAGNFTFTA